MNGFIANGKFVTDSTSEILSPRVFQVDFWKNNVGSFYFLDETESVAKAYVCFYYSNQMENHSNFISNSESLKRHREFIDKQIEGEILSVIRVAMNDLKDVIREYGEKSIWFFLLNKDLKSDMERSEFFKK